MCLLSYRSLEKRNEGPGEERKDVLVAKLIVLVILTTLFCFATAQAYLLTDDNSTVRIQDSSAGISSWIANSAGNLFQQWFGGRSGGVALGQRSVTLDSEDSSEASSVDGESEQISIPEPATLAVLIIGGLLTLLARRRRA